MFGRRLIWTALCPVLMALVFGCKMGPDYQRPEPDFKVPDSYQHAPSEAGQAPGDQWWKVFGDPELDRIVKHVLAHNLDMQKAATRILEVRSRFVQTRADRFPSVALQGQFQKQSQTVTTVLPGGITVTPSGRIVATPSQKVDLKTETDAINLSLPVTFEIDLWGRLARSEEAARADLLQAEESRRIVEQTIVAETVSLYLEIESYERRIEIVNHSIESYRDSQKFVEGRYQRGLVPVLTVRQARRTLAQAEATLPAIRQDLGLAQQKLSVLMGQYPETSPPRLQPEDYYHRLAPVPQGLPSELLLKRPDIRAAEASLRALNALVGVAKASRFPSLKLTGGYGYRSDDLDRLLKWQSEFWNITVGLVQPIFNAGKLKAGQRMAEARYRQGAAEYAKTVLTAFSEVEGALLRREELLERRERLVTFLEEARATQEAAEKRYLRGLTDYLNLLEAQQTRFKAEENLVLADLAILSNRVGLHRALGGGWPLTGVSELGRTGLESKGDKDDQS